MRVLHLINTNGVAGGEKHLLNLLPGLKLKGIDCQLFIVCPPEAYENLKEFAVEFINKGIITTVLSAENYVSIKTLRIIHQYLKTNGIAIIHSHLLRSDFIAVLIKQFFNKKLFLISTKHGYQENVMCDYIKESFKIPKSLLYYITRFVIKKTNANLAVSKYMADFYLNLNLSDKVFPVVHHGVDFETEYYSMSKTQSFEIIMVGRLEILKGQEFVIQAMPQILKEFPQCKLIILGIGSYEKYLKQLVDTLQIQDNVSFLGFKNSPYEFIRKADLIVIPSLAEAFGLVFIEAMGIGTPIIAFDVPAGNEILINGETGYLLPVGNVKKIAEKCITLLKNEKERIKIAENAHNYYLKNFTIQQMVDKTERFLLNLPIPSTF